VRGRSSGHGGDMTVTEWGLPDSEICSAALQLVTDVSPAFLTNHCIRSYLFGRELAAADGQLSADDDELIFLSCLLHDLGITDYGGGDQRFEVDGADAAARFLRENGVDDEPVQTVWQTIALHTSVGLAHRFGPVQAVSQLGIVLDINGFDKHRLSPGFADRVHTAFPRHDLGYAIAGAIALDVQANPMKGPPFSFPAHLHQLVYGGPALTFFDLVENSGWGDQPVHSSIIANR
jgi:hypothetical protein